MCLAQGGSKAHRLLKFAQRLFDKAVFLAQTPGQHFHMGEAALLELQLDLAEGGAAAAPVKCPLIQGQLDPRALRQAEQAAAAQELYEAERLKGAAAQVQDLPRRALGEECVEGAGQDLVLFD